MKYRSRVVLACVSLLLSFPALVCANARLVSVTPAGDGCVAGPRGPFVETWDIELQKTYTLTIDNVTDCANGGTAPTINVMVQDSVGGNSNFVATLVSTGVYTFQFTAPFQYCLTSPIRYCTTWGDPSSGALVGRHDTGLYQAHLRYSTFGEGCTDPVPADCPVPTLPTTWGRMKTLYR